jgi:hypothetical protein
MSAAEPDRGYVPHFLQGPPRRIGEARVPDPRTAQRRQTEIGMALHTLARDYRETPTAEAREFVAKILAESNGEVPGGSVTRLESATQAIIGGWRVLSYGVEPRITDQTVAWFAWLVPGLAPPFGWLGFWTVAWAAHCCYAENDPPWAFPFEEPDRHHEAYVKRRAQVLQTAESFGFKEVFGSA